MKALMWMKALQGYEPLTQHLQNLAAGSLQCTLVPKSQVRLQRIVATTALLDSLRPGKFAEVHAERSVHE